MKHQAQSSSSSIGAKAKKRDDMSVDSAITTILYTLLLFVVLAGVADANDAMENYCLEFQTCAR